MSKKKIKDLLIELQHNGVVAIKTEVYQEVLEISIQNLIDISDDEYPGVNGYIENGILHIDNGEELGELVFENEDICD